MIFTPLQPSPFCFLSAAMHSPNFSNNASKPLRVLQKNHIVASVIERASAVVALPQPESAEDKDEIFAILSAI